MQKLVVSVFSGLLLCTNLNSQEIKVQETKASFSSGSHNALTVNIYDTSKEAVEKGWRHLMKDYHPEKIKEEKTESFYDNATFKPIGNNTVDVYAKIIEQSDKSIQLVVCYDLGGAYLNSSEHKEKFEFFKKMMRDFALNLTNESINEELKQAGKSLENILDKEHDLEKDNKNLNEEITSYTEKINKDKDKIEKNKQDIEVKKKEAEAQQKIIDGLKAKLKSVK